MRFPAESSHKTRPVKIPAQVPQTGTGQRVSVLKKPAANSSPDRLETSFLRGTRIENLKRSTWWMWATRYERSFKGVFAMMTSKAKRDAARYYQSWHADTPYPEALRAVSLTDPRAICPECEEPIESYHVVEYQYDGVPCALPRMRRSDQN
jgi:hypothetical protein